MDAEIAQQSSLEHIASEVDANGGIVTLPMWQIRNAYGAGRLGSTVRSNISEQLENLGLRHFPDDLPNDQNALVRLWRSKSAVGKIIRATRRVGDDYDQRLREAASQEAQHILRQIRDIVCP
jgi:hypothetical protein